MNTCIWYINYVLSASVWAILGKKRQVFDKDVVLFLFFVADLQN
jgi:hypothetical protein